MCGEETRADGGHPGGHVGPVTGAGQDSQAERGENKESSSDILHSEGHSLANLQ